MRLYELKFEIKEDQKERLIRGFGLEFSRQYSDTDYFLETSDNTKQKYKEVEGRTILYKLNFNSGTGLFEIDDEELTESQSKIDEIKKIRITGEVNRTKDVYLWPGKPIRLSFDSIEGTNKLYCEIYDKNEAAVFEAKRKVVELGHTKFIDKTYDELIQKSNSILNLLIIVAIMAVIGFIAYSIFK